MTENAPAQLNLILNLEPLNAALTGVGVYVREVVSQILASGSVAKVTFFCGHRRISLLEAEGLLGGRGLPSARKPGRGVVAILHKYWPQPLWMLSNFLFWWRTRGLKDHVYVELNNVARPFRGKTIVVVHDLSHIHHPDCHPRRRILYFNRYFDASLKRSSHIVTVSRAIEREVCTRYGFTKATTVASPACSSAFRRREAEECQPIREKYRLPSRFILTVCTMEPRKNLEGLIDAYCRLPDQIRRSVPLVTVGAEGWKNDRIKERLRNMASRGEAFVLGYVPEQDLPGLYSLATLFAYVSLYEGFGIPVVEAMSCGTPVIVSTDAALQEATDGASVCVDAHDPEALRNAFMLLLGDPGLCEELGSRGMARCSVLSWEAAATKLLSAVHVTNGGERASTSSKDVSEREAAIVVACGAAQITGK